MKHVRAKRGDCVPGEMAKQRQESAGEAERASGLAIGDAVAEKIERGEYFDAANLCRSEDGGLAGRIWDSDFDAGVFFITFLAAETEAAFGNVVALDDFFVEMIHADAGGEVDASADVAAAICFAATGKSRRRESRGFRCGLWFGGERGRGDGLRGDGSASVRAGGHEVRENW